ncbi:hypothetical protein CNX70_14665 [Janthinobacterium svalbardensis]|uniref:Uncharacterized protein n=1 Tax=Janthinobacterium svalbardensis TaxID=368607 RepID=A0A290WWJ7_9BURK|nr:hypothetical protein CNX70_14665 [Janthinobacterium svalbardensis]
MGADGGFRYATFDGIAPGGAAVVEGRARVCIGGCGGTASGRAMNILPIVKKIYDGLMKRINF